MNVVPFLWVRDIEASVHFYRDLLGFEMLRTWRPRGKLTWCWLEREGAAVMLQEFLKEGPHRNVPESPVGLGVSLNFRCDDAIALYREFRARDVAMSVPNVGNGLWVTETKDPDGYRLFFASPTDEAEETVYSE